MSARGPERRGLFAAAVGLVGALACHAAAPPVPTPNPVALASRACARIASCSHAHDPVREREPSACVDWWLSRHPGQDDTRTCLASARSCEAIDACAGAAGDARAIAFCSSHPGVQTACDENARIACGTDDVTESTSTDCASLGASCTETHGAGGLLSHACVDPTRCPPEATRARCDGEAAVIVCHDGAIERTACGPASRCHAHAHGDGAEFAECVGGADQECTAVGSTRCEGSMLVECEPHGHSGRARTTDCGALGLSVPHGGDRASCVERDARCMGGLSRCEGEALEFCAAGRREQVSCESLGMGPCDPDARGMQAGCKVADPPAIR